MVLKISNIADLKAKLAEAGSTLVVIDFFATWCGPCKMIAPKLEELSQELKDVIILKVDVDECEDIAFEYEISSMPTFVFIKDGSVVQSFAGANFDKLKATIQEFKEGTETETEKEQEQEQEKETVTETETETNLE